MKLGFYSPLPPAPTGVAAYSAALLEQLRECADKNDEVEPGAPQPDLALYHIGNNALHREIYRRALTQPGVVTLHDAVLHHFFLGMLTQPEYKNEFVYNYGEWTRGLAADLWNNRARSAADPRYFEYPMLKRLVKTSRGIIVHNPAARRIVERHDPGGPVVEIPHLHIPPALPGAAATASFRAQLGIEPGTLLAGVFGHLRESKRLAVVLRAMERLWQEGVDVKLLVQGAFASSDLQRSFAPLLENHPRILRAGYLDDNEFWRLADATDVCINLRYPTAAETSGIAISMMGAGKAVIFTAGEELARFPENACLRVETGAAEEELLADYLRWLATNREAASEIGRRAAAHIRQEHNGAKVAAAYWDFLKGF